MDKFVGIRSFVIGFFWALVPAATQYLGAVDWNSVFSFLGPQYSTTVAMLVSGVVMVILRSITSTPPLTNKDGEKVKLLPSKKD